jgi:hypothetical protein
MDLEKPRKFISKETTEVDPRDTVSLFSDTHKMLKKPSKSLTDSSLKEEKFSPGQTREILKSQPSKVIAKRLEEEEVAEEEQEVLEEPEVDNERIVLRSFMNPLLLIYEAR